MARDYRTFIFAYLAFGPAIGFATLCLPIVVFATWKNWQSLRDWQGFPSGIAGLFVLLSFALVFGMLPAFINFALMMPFIKRASRRTILWISPITGYLATATAVTLPRLASNEQVDTAILIQALVGVIPAVCCTLIASRLQDRKQEFSIGRS